MLRHSFPPFFAFSPVEVRLHVCYPCARGRAWGLPYLNPSAPKLQRLVCAFGNSLQYLLPIDADYKYRSPSLFSPMALGCLASLRSRDLRPLSVLPSLWWFLEHVNTRFCCLRGCWALAGLYVFSPSERGMSSTRLASDTRRPDAQ